MKRFAMRLLLCLLVVCCEARRIPRGLEYRLFPNLRTVHHGHGATSYQNVEIENHNSVPVPTHSADIHNAKQIIDYEDQDHRIYPVTVLGTEAYVLEQYIVSTADPYFNDETEHFTIEEVKITPHHYQQYEHEENYEYD